MKISNISCWILLAIYYHLSRTDAQLGVGCDRSSQCNITPYTKCDLITFLCTCENGFIGNTTQCNDIVRVTGVRNTSFQFNFTERSNASYLIRVYQQNDLIIESRTNLTNVTFKLDDPTTNVYMVEVASLIGGVQSNFSLPVSTKIWNITSVTSNSISIDWELYSPVSFYEYDLCDSQGVNRDNGNAPNNTHTFQNLLPSTLYIIKIWASRLLPPFENDTYNIAMVPLLILDQYTVTIPPNPRVVSQTQSDLVIAWDEIPAAQGYISRLFLNETSASGISGLGETTALSTTLSTLSPGLIYTFQLCSISQGGESCTNLSVIGYLLPPDRPQPIAIAQTSLTLTVPEIPSALQYVFTAFLGNTNISFTINNSTSEGTITGLQPLTIYSVRATLVYPAGSVTGEASLVETAHDVVDLTADLSGTAAYISFDSVSRLEEFSIIVTNLVSQTPLPTTIVTRQDAIIDDTRTSGIVRNLVPNTRYRFFVTVNARNQLQMLQSATGMVNGTTSNITGTQNVRVIDVRSSGFNVSIGEIQQASSYTVRVYFQDSLFTEVDYPTPNVPITGVNPVENVYYVSAAFNTPAPSEFSSNRTTRIWNFTDISTTSVFVSWLEYSTNAVYTPINRGNGITSNTNKRITGLIPGSINILGIIAAEFSSTSNDLVSVPLFSIPQLTLPAAPTPFIVSQDIDLLIISWNEVTGADSYNTSFTFSNGMNVPGANLRTTSSNSVSISNLSPGINYTFTVCSVNTEGQSCSNLDVFGLTIRPEPPEVISTTQFTIEVRITGVISALSYIFTAALQNGTIVSTTHSTMPSAILSNLMPGTIYILRATIVYESQLVTGDSTTQVTAPADPADLRLLSSTSIGTEAGWTNDGSVTLSLLSLERTDKGTLVFQDRSVARALIFLDILQPGTNYTLCVRNRNSAGDSGSVCITFQTAPATPIGLNFGMITQSTISVFFNEAIGADRYNLVIISPVQNFMVSSTNFQFVNLSPGSNYTITVQAFSPPSVNPLGSLGSPVSQPLFVKTAPLDVSNLMVTDRTSTSLTITYSRSLGATGYEISWTLSAINLPRSMIMTGTSVTLTELLPGTPYNITVLAMNSFGTSMATGILTNEFTRSISPSTPTLREFTTNSFTASWSAQAGSISYVASVVLASDGTTLFPISFPRITNNLQIEVTGLMPGTVYNVSIATNDRFGLVEQGLPTSEITVPGQTTRLQISNQGKESLEFDWNSVQGASSYQVVVRDARTNTIRLDENVNGLSYVAGSLSNGVEYVVLVSAANRNGIGEPVNTTTFTVVNPFEAVVVFIDNTETTITVNHTSGVLGVVRYRVIATITIVEVSSCESDGFTCTLTGLDSGTDYNISVIGIYSSMSQSDPSSPLLATTVPAMPDNPFVIRSDFNLFLMVRRVVGATTYTATLERIVMESDTPNSLFTGLISGQNYSMSIFATKITGYGSFSSRVLAVNSSTTRAIPFGVTVANIGQNQFDVLWNNVAGAISYVVTVAPVNTSLVMFSGSTTQNSLTATNLQPGETYNVTVRGIYSNGPGEDSEVIQQVTGPAVPLNLRIVSVGASFVELTWSMVRSATMYRVTYSALTDSFYDSVELSTNLVNVTNLMAATVYRFEVVALFGVLESSAAVLHQITAPISPRFLIQGATQTTIMAGWSTESGTDSFLVQVFFNNLVISEIWTPDSSAEFTYLDGIMPGQNYSFCVQGKTVNTSAVGILQLSEMSCTFIATDPGNATMLVEISTTSQSLTVAWSPAVGASYYEVSAEFISITQRSLTPSFFTTVFGAEMATVTGLSANRDYEVSVTPYNFLDKPSFRLGNLTVTTNPNTPRVFLINVTATTMTIGWVTDPNFIFLSIVRVRSLDSCDQAPIIQENGEFFIRMGYVAGISNLCPAVNYSVSVTVFTTLKKSQPGFIVQPTAPINPQNVTIIRGNQEFIECVWNPSPGADCYFVRVIFEGNVIFENKTTEAEIIISNLKAAEIYTFELIAGNSMLNSSITQINTTTITTPQPPFVQFVNATSSGITIHFIQPLPGLTTTVEGLSTTGQVLKAENLNGSKVVFPNITLGVNYNFSLVTMNIFGDRSAETVVNATAPLNGIPSRVSLLPSIPYLSAYEDLTSTQFIGFRNMIGNALVDALTPGTGLQSVKLQEVYLSNNNIFAEFTSNTNTRFTTFDLLNETFQANKNSSLFTSSFTEVSPPLPPTVLNATIINGAVIFGIARLPSVVTVTLVANNSINQRFTVENNRGPNIVLNNITLGTVYQFNFFAINNNQEISQPLIIANVTVPPLTFSIQVGLIASLATDPALNDQSSPQYLMLVQQLTSEMQSALQNVPGFSNITVTAINQENVTAEFSVIMTRQDISTNILTETFSRNLNSDTIDKSLVRITDLSEESEEVDTSHTLILDEEIESLLFSSLTTTTIRRTTTTTTTTTRRNEVIRTTRTTLETETIDNESTNPDAAAILGSVFGVIAGIIIIAIISNFVYNRQRREYNKLLC